MASAPTIHHRLRLLVALFVAVLVSLGDARLAAAHTSLVSSIPGDGEIVERAPDRLQLHFATAVDPESLAVELSGGDGADVRSLTLVDPDGPPSFDVAAELPDLDPGAYVASWVSVGPDGHRASGEVVFGVGAVALADLRSAGSGSGGVDGLALVSGVARWGLAAALALATGAALATRWSRLHTRASPLVPAVGRRVGPALDLGLCLCGILLVVRAGIVGWARRDLGTVFAGPVIAALVVAVAVLLGVIQLRRLRRRAGSFPLLDASAAAALAAVALASAGLGHAGASESGAWVLVTGALHGLAAAVWLGPLLVAVFVMRDPVWRSAPPAPRWATARQAGRSMAPLAAGSFALLAITGLGLTLVQGSWSELSATFRWTLGAKAALVVAVVLPLGALHDRWVGWTRDRSSMSREPRLARSLAAEAIALAVVFVAGSTLATANPLAGVSGTDALAAVDDPSTCNALPAGRMSCVRRYLAGVLDGEGAAAAAAELDRLAVEVAEVGRECHQLAHDLGNDAVAAFGSPAAALADAPPTCWSGYYHGVVELAVAEIGRDPSGAELHGVCEPLGGKNAYTLPHYNCVHGLGHGVMLLTDHALMPALDLCERVEDAWERSSCLSGVFMERVISIQAAPERDDSGGDLLYPCSEVNDDQLDECYAMQSSYFLWKLDYDYAAAFQLCDQAESAIQTCYRSMGRDIASLSLHDPGLVAERCAMGAELYFASCVEAAALDAALDAVDASAAGPLCAVLPGTAMEQCLQMAASVVGSASR